MRTLFDDFFGNNRPFDVEKNFRSRPPLLRIPSFLGRPATARTPKSRRKVTLLADATGADKAYSDHQAPTQSVLSRKRKIHELLDCFQEREREIYIYIQIG